MRRFFEGQAQDLPPTRRACGFSTLLSVYAPFFFLVHRKGHRHIFRFRLLTFFCGWIKIVRAIKTKKSEI
jgi:hypothetical protein